MHRYVSLLLFDSSAARGRLLSSFADGSVDVLLIDGLHTYSGVAGDLRAWWPKMHPHGLVIMNDMPNINFLDVTRAALDFFAWRPLPRLSLGSEGTPPGAGNAALILAEQDVAPPTTARLYHKKHSPRPLREGIR